MQYDYVIVGAGLFGAVCAHELHKKGKRVLVLEKRDHIGGNVYTEDQDGIQVHKYGAHIFHTNDKDIWDYVNSFVEFNRFTNSPLAMHNGKLYNLPFNMNTFYQLWGVKTPAEAMAKIDEQKAEMAGKEPANLEEQAISLVGEISMKN
ncbi:FAD-dependent oxidoreductase [Aeromonas veronii]